MNLYFAGCDIFVVKSLSELRAHAREIFAAGVRGADPLTSVKSCVHLQGQHVQVGGEYDDLAEYHNIYLIGAGKAAASMCLAMEELLGDRIAAGLAVVKYGHGLALKKTQIIEAGHPVPDEAGWEGARRIMRLLAAAGSQDLIFLLLSGGGSALLPAPADGITLADKQRITEALLKCGATIGEINTVRKHMSKLKGGRLAKMTAPARVVSLIISDVVGDALEQIASGPTVPDTSTYADCVAILRCYGLQEKIPAPAMDLLERGARGEVAETPKPGDPAFARVSNVIVGSNRTALAAAERRARTMGYQTSVLSDAVEGESRLVAAAHAAYVKGFLRAAEMLRRPACVLAGGETTVTVRGNGFGGRNQEYALAAAIEISGVEGVVGLSAGTDGTDGPTDAAGAIVDGATLPRGRALGLDAEDHLRRNDSYHFLEATGDLLRTGPTLTNVMDLQVWLIA